MERAGHWQLPRCESFGNEQRGKFRQSPVVAAHDRLLGSVVMGDINAAAVLRNERCHTFCGRIDRHQAAMTRSTGVDRVGPHSCNAERLFERPGAGDGKRRELAKTMAAHYVGHYASFTQGRVHHHIGQQHGCLRRPYVVPQFVGVAPCQRGERLTRHATK